jgi:hypothetical protein
LNHLNKFSYDKSGQPILTDLFGLFLSKVKDSDKPIKLLLITKMIEVLYNVFLALLCTFSKGILYCSGGHTATIKPVNKHLPQTLVTIVLVVELHLLLISFTFSHNPSFYWLDMESATESVTDFLAIPVPSLALCFRSSIRRALA